MEFPRAFIFTKLHEFDPIAHKPVRVEILLILIRIASSKKLGCFPIQMCAVVFLVVSRDLIRANPEVREVRNVTAPHARRNCSVAFKVDGHSDQRDTGLNTEPEHHPREQGNKPPRLLPPSE